MPGARTAMPLVDRPCGIGLQAEDIAEQVVVAVPLVRTAEPDHELVPGGQVGQPARPVVGAAHGVDQRPRHLIEHRSGQEAAQFLRLGVREELVAQVVDDQPVVTSEGFDEG